MFVFLKSRTDLVFFAPCRVAQGEVSDVHDIEVEAFAPLFRSPGRNKVYPQRLQSKPPKESPLNDPGAYKMVPEICIL